MLLPINVLLMLATFLLGWHYILDAPAGLAVAGITFTGAAVLDRWRGRAATTTLYNDRDGQPTSGREHAGS
jgi:hypothetical protein